MAFPGVPERQCAGALVSHADRGAERRTQDNNDRGTGAQVTDRAVAPSHDRRGSGRCRVAARLGALPAEAYHCFMVRTQGSTEYKRGSRLIRGPMAGSPRILARPTTRSPQPAAVLASVKDEPSAALKKRRP